MTTLDKLSFYVMNATADDWESLDQIMPEVGRFAGVTDTSRVAHLIVELVAGSLLEEAQRKPATPQMILQTPIEYWFAMTAAGRALWGAEAPKHEHTVA